MNNYRKLIRNLRKNNHQKLKMSIFTLPTELEAIAQCLREEGINVTTQPPGTPKLPLAKKATWRLHCSTDHGEFEATHIGDKLIIKKLRHTHNGKIIGYTDPHKHTTINLADPDSFQQAANTMRNYYATTN